MLSSFQGCAVCGAATALRPEAVSRFSVPNLQLKHYLIYHCCRQIRHLFSAEFLERCRAHAELLRHFRQRQVKVLTQHFLGQSARYIMYARRANERHTHTHTHTHPQTHFQSTNTATRSRRYLQREPTATVMQVIPTKVLRASVILFICHIPVL